MKHLSDADLLGRLVAFDSTSHRSNLPIADFVCDYLDRPGIRMARQPSPHDAKTNLVFWTGPEVDLQSRKGLVLCGHLDVVPALEPDWNSHPFELIETDTSYVGRGACDMKGFVALAINALAAASQESLDNPLALLLTYDEEIGTLGARHFATAWPLGDRPLPRATIVGEPTSLRPIRMHKGHCRIEVCFRGRPAHSGYPHLGISAIEPAARFVSGVASLRKELENTRPPNSDHFPEVPFVALNIAQIEGGKAMNIIPDSCRVDIGFRVLPGMGIEDIVERISDLATTAAGKAELDLGPPCESPPLLLAEDAPICRTVCQLTGITAAESASYATDAGWLQRAGFDCLVFGPGTIEVAHKANESIPKSDFEAAAGAIRRLTTKFCRP